MSIDDRDAPAARPIQCGVLTVSDTRTLASDSSGAAIVELLGGAGHAVFERDLIPDSAEEIRGRVAHWAEAGGVDAIILTGGTGVARRDTTVEAVRPLLTKEIEGFGELFRWLSYQEIGAAAMLSRAVAGAIGPVAVFVLPGSRPAVELAMTRLVLPQLPHVCRELRK